MPRKRERSPSPDIAEKLIIIKKPKNSTKRVRSPSPDIDDSENYEEIPEEFFCPMSKKFMLDPVKIEKSHITYDRDSVKNLQKPEDVLPDLRTRNIIENWLSQYELDPPFDFISNQEDLVVAVESVLEQQQGRNTLLRELTRAILCKPWLLKNGRCIWFLATLLSCPRPSAYWVVATVSIVADLDDDIELLVPETGIHPEYSLLDPIEKILMDSHLPDNEEFKIGLVMLMNGLVVNSPDIVPLARKLEGIIKVLVSYMWPVPQYFISGWYQKLLITLERLSEIEESCQRMVDAKINGMLITVCELGVFFMEEIRNDRDNVSVIVAIETIVKIFDKLCQRSQKAREEVGTFFEREINFFYKALFNHVKTTEASVAGARVLAHIMAGKSETGLNINMDT